MANPIVRDLFACLFSGMLEFNNLFASYKGEGTDAVRHIFAHHILKPERVPLEANIWGTPKSSGSFSTILEGQFKRALDYADDPFELRPGKRNGRKAGEKVFGLSERIGWWSVFGVLMTTGFGITAVQPMKAEMSVAMPKRQAKEPIDFDVIVVYRKRSGLRAYQWNGDLRDTVIPTASRQVARFRDAGRRLSRNDVRVVVMAQLIQLAVGVPNGRGRARCAGVQRRRDRGLYRSNTQRRQRCRNRRRTLILPVGHPVDGYLMECGTLPRREVEKVVVAYRFDLLANEIETRLVANPSAGRERVFKGARLSK